MNRNLLACVNEVSLLCLLASSLHLGAMPAAAETALMEQVTSVSQLSDVQPTDWAFQALQSLVERY